MEVLQKIVRQLAVEIGGADFLAAPLGLAFDGTRQVGEIAPARRQHLGQIPVMVARQRTQDFRCYGSARRLYHFKVDNADAY
jgi:hypothetical protein